jgi:hypothetical protein
MSDVEQLVRVGAAGVHLAPPSADPEALARAAAAAGRPFVRVDVSEAADKQGLLAALARALRFPDWFGMNWDALADSFGDWAAGEPPGKVLLLDGIDGFATAAPEDLETAQEVLREALDDPGDPAAPTLVLLRFARPDGGSGRRPAVP